jgi:hypothetical protein
VELSNVEYRYGPNTVEILGRENETNWRMTSLLERARGPLASRASVRIAATVKVRKPFDGECQSEIEMSPFLTK